MICILCIITVHRIRNEIGNAMKLDNHVDSIKQETPKNWNKHGNYDICTPSQAQVF